MPDGVPHLDVVPHALAAHRLLQVDRLLGAHHVHVVVAKPHMLCIYTCTCHNTNAHQVAEFGTGMVKVCDSNEELVASSDVVVIGLTPPVRAQRVLRCGA